MQLLPISLRPSRNLICLLVFIHLGAILCVCLSAAPIWLKLPALFITGFSFLLTIKRYGLLQHPSAIVALWTAATGEWYLRAQNGKVYSAHLQGSTLLTRSLVIMNFKRIDKWFGQTVILLPDTLEATTFRRLRAYLRTKHKENK